MLTCSNCQSSLKLNAKLCIKCGHVVTDEERESAVTGVPIKKSDPPPDTVLPEVVISEPLIVEERVPLRSSSVDPEPTIDVVDAPSLKEESSEGKGDVAIVSVIPAPIEVDHKKTEIKIDEQSQPKLEPVTSSAPSQAKAISVEQGKAVGGKQLQSKPNVKLIGIVLSALGVIAIGIFLFLNGNKSNEVPISSVPEVKPAPSPAVVAPVGEAQTAPATLPKVMPEPSVAQPTKSAPVQSIQKPKSSSQEVDTPSSMPDLNRLVKDAINK